MRMALLAPTGRSSWRRLIGALVATALVALTLPLATVRAAESDRYVAAGGVDAGSCSSSAAPCRTIGYAIGQSAAGDTVNVGPGTFVENVVVDRSVTLHGDEDGATVIEPAASAPNPCLGSSLCGGTASNMILVQASNVTISNLVLDGDNPALTSGIVRNGADLDARNGIITNYLLGVYDGLVVQNVTVRNVYLRGIYAASGGSFDFHDNAVTNVQGDGYSIGMFAWGGPGIMADNRVSYANDGISANHSKGIQFLDNTVTRSASGVHTDNSGDGGGVADVIAGNTVRDCSANGYGVWVFVPYIAPTVRDNSIKGCAVGLGAFGGAFGPTVTTIFSGNRVDGARSAGSIGAYVSTTTFGYGDTNVAASFLDNLIVRNDIGVLVEETGGTTTDVVLHDNAIARNGVGLENTGATLVDATNNWWGCKAGPSDTAHCNGIIGPVNAVPWLVRRPHDAHDD